MPSRSLVSLLLAFGTFGIMATSGCKKSTEPDTDPANSCLLGEPLTLALNEKACVLTDDEVPCAIGLHFRDMNESRCPPKSVCVWEGIFIATVRINQDSIALGKTLYTNPLEDIYPNTRQFGDFSITLLDVDYGVEENFGIKEHYKVTLVINPV